MECSKRVQSYKKEWDLARKVAIKADPLVASTFWVSMHGLSGCCDLHIDHLHQCLLGAALICRISSAYFLSYWACDYVKLWLDAEELLWVYLFQLQLT